MAPLLELDGVTKQFGAFSAVDDVSFTVDAGEGITALIGPNGAGKTTTYNLLTGKLSPTEGQIRFKGEGVTGLSPAERTARGMGRSFQITNIFEGLTVKRNLRIPIVARSDRRLDPFGSVDDDEELEGNVREILELVGIEEIADIPCENLSYGDKRRVEIGITLATDPDLVLLDEPTAGMSIEETRETGELIQSLTAKGVSIVVVEHDINFVRQIGDWVTVLHNGRLFAEGTVPEIEADERVQNIYLGKQEA